MVVLLFEFCAETGSNTTVVAPKTTSNVTTKNRLTIIQFSLKNKEKDAVERFAIYFHAFEKSKQKNAVESSQQQRRQIVAGQKS